jgi:hypothetical protein
MEESYSPHGSQEAKTVPEGKGKDICFKGRPQVTYFLHLAHTGNGQVNHELANELIH